MKIQSLIETMKAFAATLPPPVRMVGNAWLLEHHAGDMYERDARGIAVRLKDGVPAPGLYVRDQEAYDAITKDPRVKALRQDDPMRGAVRFGGITVKVATAEEWAWFVEREIDDLAKYFATTSPSP